MKQKAIFCCLFSVAFLCAVPGARAGSISFASVACASTGQPTVSQTGVSTAQATNQCGFPTTHFTSGDASAQAANGLLRDTAITGGAGYGVDAKATSSFSEMATISGGSGKGTVTYEFLLTGSVVEDGGQNLAPFTVTQGADTILSLGAGDIQTRARASGICLRACGVNLLYTTQAESFTFGVPFALGATLTSEALNPYGFAQTDLTASLHRIVVIDANGNPVDFSIGYDSGATAQGGEVSEPGTLWLAIPGLLTLVFNRRGIFRRAASL